MRAYVLGLEEEFRGEVIVDECRSRGYDLQIFFGMDARRADPAVISTLYSESGAKFAIDRPLSPPEIACVWGHDRMRQRFLDESSSNWALFLEDDARLLADLPIHEADLQHLPDRPIILTLLGAPADSTILESLPIDRGRFLLRLQDPPDYAVAYVANRSAIQISIDAYRGQRIDSVPDWPYRWNRLVDFWAISPPSAGIREMDSLLDSERTVLQRAATMRISPGLQHFLLTLCGVRILKGHRLGYSAALIWRQDVTAYLKRMPWRRHADRTRSE